MKKGLTLNEAFNKVLEIRSRDSGDDECECEECSCNLRDKQVYRIDGLWVCEKCHHALLEDKKNDRYRNRHDD